MKSGWRSRSWPARRCLIGADGVAMVEHVEQRGDAISLGEGRSLHAGENVVPRGSEARIGDSGARERGRRWRRLRSRWPRLVVRFAAVVYRSFVWRLSPPATRWWRLDEIPDDQQIRNSNSYGLAALVAKAGGEAVRLPIARTGERSLEKIILEERVRISFSPFGRRFDGRVRSGGGGAALDLGAEFFLQE